MRQINQAKNKISAMLVLLALTVSISAFGGSGVSEFNVDGIKVILKHSPKEVISVNLFVEGGVTNYSKAQEGIESMALDFVMTGGTESMDKTAFSTAAEQMGTQFGSGTTYDYGNMTMTCVNMFWDKSWNLFADAIMNPAFDDGEFQLLSEQLISAAEGNVQDPDNYLRNLAANNAFKGSAYANIPGGTPESLAALSLRDVKEYYQSVVGKKRVFLVVVGNVKEADIRSKVEASLANLADGSPAKYEERNLIAEPGSNIEDRDIATNYIRGLMSAPMADSKEGIAMQMAMSILYDHFFLEIRTKRGLSYAPAAFYSTGVLKNPYNAFYVSTVDPVQSMQVMVDEVNKIKKEGLSEKELRNKKQRFLTSYLMGQETTAQQANALGAAEITGGWELAENFTERANGITLEELNRVFDEYTKTISWTYLGKADAVTGEDFPQPEITLEIMKVKD